MKIKRKKIATNLPEDLLREAVRFSGLNQTETIVAGLKELIRAYKLRSLLALKGKLAIEYNPTITRGRGR